MHKLITKLMEKRNALISQTISRGLPPEATCAVGPDSQQRFKPSGIDWLGDVPEHWSLKRLGWHVDLLTGFPFKSDLFSFNEGIRLVRGDNITEGQFRWGDKTRYWAGPTDGLEAFFLRPGDLLIGMDGSKVGRNYAVIAEEDLPLLLVQRVARLRVTKSLETKLLSYLIGSELFRIWVELTKTDPAVPHISSHDIRSFPILLPPVREQNAIVSYLDRETAKLDQMVDKTESAIKRFQEYRTALITATVTGKIDIREVTA
jgi:type I restriction enzyme, S subunit